VGSFLSAFGLGAVKRHRVSIGGQPEKFSAIGHKLCAISHELSAIRHEFSAISPDETGGDIFQ
jgi:hypothetical protein